MRRVTYDFLREYRLSIGAPWFTKAWDVNLIIVRSGKVGYWDDWVFMACLDDYGREVLLRARATGDAWEGEWTNPTHPDGCIYVLDQHVSGGYTIGTHKGRPALIQAQPFLNVRWPASKQSVPTIQELEDHAAAGNSFMDNRGCNLHNRWSYSAPGRPAPNDSEGCTVVLYRHVHAALMELMQTQKDQRGSSTVSPTFCKRSTLLEIMK